MNQMNELFHGALRVEKTAEGYAPYRFTPAGITRWGERRSGWLIRSSCTSSVSLAFFTDSDKISLSFSVSNFSRPFVGFDVYENDSYTRHFDFEDNCTGGTLEYVCRNAGEKKIEIFLSCLNQIVISSLHAENIRPVPQNPHRLLFLGDSITQGMTAKCPSLIYPTLYARKRGMQAVNLGVGGAKYEDWQLDDFPDYGAEEVFLAYGINDLCSNPDTPHLLSCAESYLQKVAALFPTQPKTVLTPIWNRAIDEDEGFAPRFRTYSDELTAIAKGLGYRVIDGLTVFPNDRRFTFDGTHPTDEGFAYLALSLL